MSGAAARTGVEYNKKRKEMIYLNSEGFVESNTIKSGHRNRRSIVNSRV